MATDPPSPSSATKSTALVTGANKGIGLETARQLGLRGMHVIVASRDGDRGRAATATLAAQGIGASHVVLDVTREDSIAKAAETVAERFGVLDVLVNNAGISGVRVPPSELTTSHLRDAFETNCFGAFAVTRALLPALRGATRARIVNVSTTSGSLFRLSDPEWAYAPNVAASMAYSASKAALNVLTIALARELQGAHIKVNAVCPGYTATDFNQFRGTRSVESAVAVIVKFATLDESGPTGGFFDEAGRIPW